MRKFFAFSNAVQGRCLNSHFRYGTMDCSTFVLILMWLNAQQGAANSSVPADWKSFIHPSILKEYQESRLENEPSAFSRGLFEGDVRGMDIPLEDASQGSKALQLLLGARAKNAVRDESLRWLNHTIPYVISSGFREVERKLIIKALQMMSKEICLTFKERKSEKDYVKFIRGFNCWSFVGRNGGEQEISVTRGCLEQVGDVQHEVLHALGFLHEHSRTDRDDYIIINWENIATADRGQFVKYTSAEADHFGLPYDYESVMHYPYAAFAADKDEPTIVPRKKASRIGQRRKLSTLDVAKVRKLYGCDEYEAEHDTRESGTPDETTETPFTEDSETASESATFTTVPSSTITARPKPRTRSPSPALVTAVPAPVFMEKPCQAKFGFFNHPKTGACLSFTILCDGRAQLTDGWDEVPTNCRAYCRGPTWITSPVGVSRCVSTQVFCNGQADLVGGYDEAASTCALITAIAARDLVISPSLPTAVPLGKHRLCNGIKDTPSGWDEVETNCKQHCSSTGYVLAQDRRSSCLLKTALCNGVQETDNGWDEQTENCQRACADSLYMTQPESLTSQCVRRTAYCSGEFSYKSPIVLWNAATSSLYQCPAQITFVETDRGVRCDIKQTSCPSPGLLGSARWPFSSGSAWNTLGLTGVSSPWLDSPLDTSCSSTRKEVDYMEVTGLDGQTQCMAIAAVCSGYRLFLPAEYAPGSPRCQSYNKLSL